MELTIAVVSLITLTTSVIGERSCSRNGNLMKSIQYQLKLVEENEGKCNCAQKGDDGKVAFLVRSSKDLVNVATGSTVVFDTAITNVGGGYDTSTGIFTSPDDGLYFFTWTTTNRGGKYFPTTLTLNGKEMARNHGNTSAISNNLPTTQSVVLQMKKDDKVLIKLTHPGQFMYGELWSTFSGYKI